MHRTVAGFTLILANLVAQAALQGRSPATPNGTDYRAYYDTVLNITWLADANYAQTSGFDGDGLMDWGSAQAWIASLNTAAHLGVSNWRQPKIRDTGTPGCNNAFIGTDCGYNVQTGSAATTIYSEMASLFYDTLGNMGSYDTAGTPTGCFGHAPPYCLANAGPFSNIQRGLYWSGTEYAPDSSYAWEFTFGTGFQNAKFKAHSEFNWAWAVRPGDIAAVSSIPIVTNLAEPNNFAAGLGGALVEASSFTTDALSYTLGGITLDLQVNSPATIAVSLFSDSGGLPGSPLENLDSQFIANVGQSDRGFPASGATVLQPNTRYWVVVEQIGSGSIQWVSTYSTAESSSGFVTIGNDMYYRNVGQMTWNPQASATDTGQFAVHDDTDTDSDGIADGLDNCRMIPNNTGAGAQCDTDGDGFGNRCDADFIGPAPGNGATNVQDYGYFRTRLGTTTTPPTYDVADLNCNAAVNIQDYAIFRSLLGKAPGPGAGP